MIYILGSGYIAQAYVKYFLINSIPHKVISRKDVLYTNPLTLAAFLTTAKPSLLINAAGFAYNDSQHKLASTYSNATLPGFIGELCQSMNIPWIHISTCDCYKSTPQSSPYNEIDTKFSFDNSLTDNYHGFSKMLGEELIRQYNNVYVCRIRKPFSEKSDIKNYLTRLIRNKHIIDLNESLTNLNSFTHATYSLWDKQAPFGTYNVVDGDTITTSCIVKELIGAGLKTDECTFSVTSYMNICNSKLTGIVSMPSVVDSIKECIRGWRS